MFFKSTNVKIFPCYYRGNKQNPEARLATEYNFTHIPGLLMGYDSFVVEHTDACVRCVIHGYYFEFTGEAAGKLQDTDGNLKGKLMIREGKLASQSENSSNYLLTMAAGDQPSLDTGDDDESYCTAVWYELDENTANNDSTGLAKFSGTEGIQHTLDLKDEYRRIIINKNNVHSLKVIEDHVDDKENPHGVTAERLGVAAFENKTLATSVIQDDANAVTGGAVHTAIEAAKNNLKGDANDAATAETIEGAKKYASAAVNNLASQVNTNTDEIEKLQKAITGTQEGSADGLTGQVSANATAIENLQKEFADGGRVTSAESKIAALESKDIELSNAIGTKLATGNFNTWKGTHENDHAKSATEITSEINTAVSDEKSERKAADTNLSNRLDKVEAFFATGKDEEGNDIALNEDLDTLVELQECITGDCLKRSELENAVIGVYAVAFDLSTYSGNPEDLSSDFKAATSSPIVFISGCSMLPSPPEGYAWFDSSNEDALEVEAITTNIILYLKESNTPEKDPETVE